MEYYAAKKEWWANDTETSSKSLTERNKVQNSVYGLGMLTFVGEKGAK